MIPYIHAPKIPTEIAIQPAPFSAIWGQNKLCEYAIKKDPDYLMLLDSDISPVPGCLEKMIADDKDIITAPIWFFDINHFDIHLNVSLNGSLAVDDRLRTRRQGLERIESASFGALLIKQAVLRKFRDAKESLIDWSPLIDPFYQDTFGDSIFFAKAKALGFEAYVDWDIKDIIHSRIVELCDETINNIRSHQ